MLDVQTHSSDLLVVAFDRLRDTGLEPYFAVFDYAGCDRRDPTYRGQAFGRLDQPAGRGSTATDARQAHAALVELGWTPVSPEERVDGNRTVDDRWGVELSMDDLVLNMAFFAVGPECCCASSARARCQKPSTATSAASRRSPLEERIGLPLRPADTSPPTTE